MSVKVVFGQSIVRPPIVGIAYVELKVSDIKKSFSFYEGLLGYKCIPSFKIATKQGAFFIPVNHRQSIKMLGGLAETEDERLVAIGFQTTDAEAMRMYLSSKSISVPDRISKDSGNSFSFSILDPDKHEIRFIQNILTENQLIKAQNPNLISDRILHAGITIRDLSLANSFYVDILGFSEIWRGGVTDTTTNWVNMRLPESTDYLEYMLIKEKLNRFDLGVQHHIALLVPDMQKALDKIRSRAMKLGIEASSPRIGRNKKWQLNLYDPDGTRIELMEPFTVR
jgi:lactoylglutathione lyase